MAAEQSLAGYIDSQGSGKDIVDKTIDAVIQRKNDIPLVNGRFMRIASSPTGDYKESQIGNVLRLPEVSEDGSVLPMATTASGFPKELNAVTFRLGIQVQRKMQEDDRLGQVPYLVGGLADIGRTRLEYSFANEKNTAFSALGADGVAICSDSHPHARADGGTWDNLETAAALSAGTFSTARKNMWRRTNEGGHPMPLMPELLEVSPENEEVAKQIAASELVPDNALNAKNVWKGSFEVLVNPWLTSTTAWFVWSSLSDIPQSGGMVYFRKAAPAIEAFDAQDPDILMSRRLRMRYAVGTYVEPRIQGNAGA